MALRRSIALHRGLSLTERIVARHVVGRTAEDAASSRSGCFVSVRPAFVMTHDNTAAVISKSAVQSAVERRQRQKV